jgi:hypothetical protein
MKKNLIVMFLLGLSTLLFLYIPQFPTRCHEYVGEIDELQYYYHPPILSIALFYVLYLFVSGTALGVPLNNWGIPT